MRIKVATMNVEHRLLVMAGAREAHEISESLSAKGLDVVATLPEPERGMSPLRVPDYPGDFGDEAAVLAFLKGQGITRVIDASHAFDAALSGRAAQVCADHGIPYARVLRPAWQPGADDQWTAADDVAEAARRVPAGARVFSNTGRGSVAQYADFAGAVVFLRRVDPGGDAPPYAFMRYVAGTPPFVQADEEALFRELRIDTLICRNVGGAASRAKVDAARALGIDVLMIQRPAPPRGAPCFATARDAIAWATE